MNLRRCNKCHLQKPIDQFNWQDEQAGKRHPWCRDCIRVATRQSRLKRLDHYRAVNRAWWDRHQAAVEEARRRHSYQGIQYNKPVAA